MSEGFAGSIENIVNDSRDVSSIEMGCDEIQLSCTTGKVKVWFGRQTGGDVVNKVLQCFSMMDPSFVHETEIICEYDHIPKYQNHDYTLISYGRAGNSYRAIFNIQLSKQDALDHFIESIIQELEQSEVEKTLHWNGSIDRIILIYNELKELDGWDVTKIEYREEE